MHKKNGIPKLPHNTNIDSIITTIVSAGDMNGQNEALKSCGCKTYPFVRINRPGWVEQYKN